MATCGPHRPCYAMGVAAELVNLHPQTLRRYEELGLVKPARVSGRRLYSEEDIERLRLIARLTDDLGVNLAGVGIILNMRERMARLQREMEQMRAYFEQEIEQLRQMAEQEADGRYHTFPHRGSATEM